jgi:hypothetical protein
MNPQLGLFERTRRRLGVRGLRAYWVIHGAMVAAQSGGRLVGAGRWSRVRWEFDFGLQRTSIRALEEIAVVRWDGDDLVWVGWEDTDVGRKERFRREQAERGREGARRRWGAKRHDDRPGDRPGDRHLTPNPAQPLKTGRSGGDSGRHGPRAPAPEIPDLRSGSGLRKPFEQSSSSQGEFTSPPPRPAPAGPPARPPTPAREVARPEDREARTGRATLSPRGSDTADPVVREAIPISDSWGGRAAENVPWGPPFDRREFNREKLDRVLERIVLRQEGP